MPEVLTKYPDVVVQVLREGGARCGTGAEQKILTTCPREKFCSLSGGEICVYGLTEITKMTQVKRQELAQIVCPGSSSFSVPGGLALLPLTLGAALGGLWQRRRRVGPRSG